MRAPSCVLQICHWAALALCVVGATTRACAEPRLVFVDINRLVAAVLDEVTPANPAPPLRIAQWQTLLPSVPAMELQDATLTAVARWRASWLSVLTSEAQAALRPIPTPERIGAPRFALPTQASAQGSLSPEEWRFLVERAQTQIVERASIRLRLAFADRLSAVERERLRQRLQALDEALRLPLAPPPPLPPAPPTAPPEPVTLTSLTDERQIAVLVAPPADEREKTEQVVDWQLLPPPLPPRSDASSALRRAVEALASAFAIAYGRERGWQVVFNPVAGAEDRTAEVLAAWKRWWD